MKNQNLKQTILKNTFWLTIAEIFQKGFTLLIMVWIARHFGPATYGQWAFALHFVGLFSMFADFGFSSLTVREIARDKSKTSQYLDNIIVMKFVLGVMALGAIAFVIQFLGKQPEVERLVYFLGIYTVINTYAAFFNSIFRANEEMQYEAICRIVQGFSLFGLMVFFMLTKESLLAVSYAYIGASLCSILVALFFIWHFFSNFFLKVDFRVCKDILKEAWPFGLAFLFISGYYHADTVMLAIMKNDTAVGWYNAAYQPLLFLLIIPSLLQTVFFPRMSHSFTVSKDQLNTVLNQHLQLVFIISVPICIGTLLLGKRFIFFIYGANYQQSVNILQILIWSFLFAAIGGVLGNTLNSCDKQRTLMKITGVALVANILLNLLLIPTFSYMGASVATNLTRFFVIITEFLLLLKMGIGLKIKDYFKMGTKIILASVMMGAFLVIFKTINLFLLIFLATGVYFGFLYLMKGFDKIYSIEG